VRSGKKPADWTAEALVKFDPAFKPEMIALMKPSEGMKTREIRGGTGPSSVKAALETARARLIEMTK
jgi:argininosuccinate lyase